MELAQARDTIAEGGLVSEDPRFRRIARWSYGDPAAENCLVHGENLAVMTAMAENLEECFRCIYLDPPYNNGDSYEHYFDNLGHEEWLESVQERLVSAKQLLRKDGSVWISIDDSEMHYLKVMADGVFGRENFIGTIVWERRTSRENRRMLSRNHEYLLVYAKCLKHWASTRNYLPLTDEVKARYANLDDDPRGPWQSVTATAQKGHGTPQQYYAIKTPDGSSRFPPNGRCWVYNEKRMKEEIKRNNIWFGKNGSGAPRIKHFLSERTTGLTPETLWYANDVGTTASAKKHLVELFSEMSIFDTPKPEQLIQRILHISTDPGDWVLDPYLGSGTFTAVAHKTERRYVGIEKGEHAKSHCSFRQKTVIKGESGGISTELEWQGGGGVHFYRYTNGPQAVLNR